MTRGLLAFTFLLGALAACNQAVQRQDPSDARHIADDLASPNSAIDAGPGPDAADDVDPGVATGALKLVAPPGGGIYLAAHDQSGGVAEIEAIVGRRLALRSLLCPGDGGTENTRPAIDIPCREALYQQGILTTYGIEATGFFDTPAFTVQGVIDGAIDEELRQVARAIARWGRPLLWLYQREPEIQFGGYGPDGQLHRGQCAAARDPELRHVDPCNRTAFGDPDLLDGPERFVAFHRHIHQIVEGEIARLGRPSPITWVMGGPATDGQTPVAELYRAFYPGADVVDWHMLDFYAGCGDEGTRGCAAFDGAAMGQLFDVMAAVDPGKPVMALEFGLCRPPTGGCGDRGSWLRAFFQATRTERYRPLALLLYWQATDYPFDTRIEQGEGAAGALSAELGAHPDHWPACLGFSDGSQLCPR